MGVWYCLFFFFFVFKNLFLFFKIYFLFEMEEISSSFFLKKFRYFKTYFFKIIYKNALTKYIFIISKKINTKQLLGIEWCKFSLFPSGIECTLLLISITGDYRGSLFFLSFFHSFFQIYKIRNLNRGRRLLASRNFACVFQVYI